MDDLYAAAERLEQLGRIGEAAEAYERAAQAGLRGAEPLIRKAFLDSQRGDIRAAMTDLERAEAADPANPYPRLRLAHLTAGMARRLVTVEHLRAACAIEPWNVEMKVNLASAYLKTDWLDLAFAMARVLPEEVGDWWAEVRGYGLNWYRTARAEALAALRERRTRSFNHNDIYHLARKLYRVGRLRTAQRLCEQIIAENPDWFLPFWLLADILARRGGPDAGVAQVRAYRLNDDAPDYAKADVLEAETTHLNEAGRFDELLQRLQASPHAERREHVRHIAAVAAFMTGRDAELRAHCVQWMTQSPLNAAPAGFIVLMHARDSAAGPNAAAGPEPRPAGVHMAQFWNTPTPPADVVEAMESWTRLHPSWTRTLFDEAAARAFIAGHCGQAAQDAFALCYHPAMMADFFRIAFLQAHGGLYADADEACVRPVDAILPDVGLYEVVAPRADGVPGFVDTPFLGARRGSRVLARVLEDIVANILKAAQEGRRPSIWETTGPGALTRGVAHHLIGGGSAGDDIALLPIQQLRTFVQTRDMLYKLDPKMNWRMATAD